MSNALHLDACPPSVPSRIARAVLSRLRQDDGLIAVCGAPASDEDEGAGGIFACEAEDLIEQSTFAAPALAVILAGWQVVAEAGDAATLRTTVSINLLSRPSRGTSRWLRARILDRVLANLWRDQGILYDDETGERLTESILDERAVVLAVRLPGSGLLTTPLNVTFSSLFDRSTREFLP